MQCPSCNATLEEYEYHHTLSVEVCPTCRGMWLGRGKLGALIAYLGESDAVQATLMAATARHIISKREMHESVKRCAHCGVPMEQFNYAYDSNIILDRCRACDGVWMDRGELYKIVLHALHVSKKNGG